MGGGALLLVAHVVAVAQLLDGRAAVTPRNDATPASPCGYAVGERVEHPKFGAGTIVRIESITTDHKIVVDFGSYGEKTLLARFAKLRKL